MDTLFCMTISILFSSYYKKAKFINPVNCRSLIYKQNGNSQQAAFRHSQGAWNHIMMHFI